MSITKKLGTISLMLAFLLSLLPTLSAGKAEISREQGTELEIESTPLVTVVVPPSMEYDEISQFSEGLAAVRKNGAAGYIDKTGTVVIPQEYHYALPFSEGLAVVITGDPNIALEHFYIDKTGAVAIPPRNSIYFGTFTDGLAPFSRGTSWGAIDKSGEVVIPLGEYDEISAFSEGLLAVQKGGKWGFIDKNFQVVVPLIYDSVQSFSEGLAAVNIWYGDFWTTSKWGYINKNGEVVIPIEYDRAEPFSEGLALIQNGYFEDTKYSYIDKAGAVIIPSESLEYDGFSSFSEGLAAVATGSWPNLKCGYIDKDGAEIIPLEYDFVSPFSEGLAAVQKDRKWGYIDKNGKIIVPLEYDFADSFKEGVATFGNYDEWGNKLYGILQNGFSDVSADAWYTDAIKSCVANGIMRGVGGGRFDPDIPTTRAMFAQILANFDGADIQTYTSNPFDDVCDSEAWYYNAVSWAFAEGLVTGRTEYSYAPNDPITREEMAALLHRYIVKKVDPLPETKPKVDFSDNAMIAEWARDAVYALQVTALISGKPGNVFDPSANAPRAEVAQLFQNFLEKLQ